jgi:cephalosporin-C deacetylase-like acetyl esterase
VDLQIETPTPAEVDAWCDALLRRADATAYNARKLEDEPVKGRPHIQHPVKSSYVVFESDDFGTFYCFWQPVYSDGPAPLLVHFSHGGAWIYSHPDLVQAGFNVISVNPLGRDTPQGMDESKRASSGWMDPGRRTEWLVDALVATRWALSQPETQPERLATFGGSAGGRNSLLVASLMSGRGVKAVAADQPARFGLRREADGTTGPLSERVRERLLELDKAERGEVLRWLSYTDAAVHAHRLTMPVLLAAGAEDPLCTVESIQELFELLPGSRNFVVTAGRAHHYDPTFLTMALTWFKLHV